ncbi:MAG TPA: hypothetical protein VK249_13000 [Anaerolineales bacterium]|nr:hypothetical protein [Anaerolineales bacterium]
MFVSRQYAAFSGDGFDFFVTVYIETNQDLVCDCDGLTEKAILFDEFGLESS